VPLPDIVPGRVWSELLAPSKGVELLLGQDVIPIESKVAADGFEAVPPCMVGLDTFVGHDRSDEVRAALVSPVCTENLIRVDAVMESRKLTE
jgi:hypothetical protein